MWVNKSERAWRRRNEQVTLGRTAAQAESHFAAFHRAVSTLLDDPVGQRWMERFGVDRRTPLRSYRLSTSGEAQGLAVIEAVVLAGVVSRLLSDPDFVRWVSRVHPDALAALHVVAEPAAAHDPAVDERPPPNPGMPAGNG